MLLGPACAAIIAVVGAKSALACNTFVAGEALAFTSGSVTDTLIGALNPWVKVVVVDNISNPGVVLGASSQRAVSTCVFSLSINTFEASAVVIKLASAMAGALVLAHASLTMATLVPRVLAPSLLDVRGSTGWNTRRLASWLTRWHTRGLTRWLPRGLPRGLTRGHTSRNRWCRSRLPGRLTSWNRGLCSRLARGLARRQTCGNRWRRSGLTRRLACRLTRRLATWHTCRIGNGSNSANYRQSR